MEGLADTVDGRDEWLRGREGEAIPKLVGTEATPCSGNGARVAIGMGDPEFVLDRGSQAREVAVANQSPEPWLVR